MDGANQTFAVPGDDPDTYTSKIEFTPDGILANGVPLQ